MDKAGRQTPRRWAWTLWLAGLLLSALAAGWSHVDRQDRIRERLQEDTLEIVQHIQDRLKIYEYGLRGARGAVMAGGGVSINRPAFEAYVGTRDVSREFPGARGFGYIRRVAPDDLPAFLESARAEGPADFQVRQLQPSDGERFVIQYIYPLADNQGATGLDIGSETNRRDAAVAAARDGEARLTAPITLVQASGQTRRGLLFLLPVYRLDPGNDPEVRWRETIGWTYAPLVVDQVLTELGPRSHEVAMELADAADGTPFYERTGVGEVLDQVQFSTSMNIHGRTWTVRTRATSGLVDTVEGLSAVAVLAYGVLLSSALAAVVYLWLLGRVPGDMSAPRSPGGAVARLSVGPQAFARSPMFQRSLLLALLLFGLWLATSNRMEFDKAMVEHQRALDETARTYVEASQAQQAFRRRSLRFLASTPPIPGIDRALDNGGIDPVDGSSYAHWERRLQQIFTGYLESTPDVFRARYLGVEDGGHERVRVDRTDIGVQVVPHDRLEQSDGARDVREALRLGMGGVHVSDMELHREGGVVQRPVRPAVRYATPVFNDKGKLTGVVVIHVDRNRAVQQFPVKPPEGASVLVTNGAGDYVIHGDRAREFGFETGNRQRWQDDHERVAPFRAGGVPRWRNPQAGVLLAAIAEVRSNPDSDTGLMRFHVVLPEAQVRQAAWDNVVARVPVVVATLLLGLSVVYLYWVGVRRREEVQRQRLRLATIVEQTRDAIIGLDPEGRITSWNRGAQVLFGHSAEEAIGQSVESLVVPPDDDGARVHVNGAAGAGDTPNLERWLRTKNGRLVEVAITLSPIIGADGQPAGAAAIVRDITDERAAQREVAKLNASLEQQVRERTASLSHERQRLENILRGTNAGTWEWNVQTGERRYNERWAGMLGLTIADVTALGPRPWHALVHPEDAERSGRELRRHFTGEIDQYECELRMRHRDGRWIWVLDRGRVNSWTEDGKPLWMYGTHRDITAAKEAQQRLAASEGLLDRTGRVAGVGGWQFDLREGTVVWTPQMYAIHEVGLDFEVNPSSPLAFYEGEARREVMQALRRARKEGEPFDFEVPFRTARGRELRMRVVGEPVFDDSGKAVQIVGALQDVTDRHLMEAELLRINALQHSILEHMPGAISAFDANLRLVAWNSAFVKMLGLEALFERGVPSFEDILRFNAARGEYGEGDVEDKVLMMIERARHPVPHRFERVRPDGTPIEVRGTPMPGGGFVTTYMDMTERRRAEQSVARSEALLRGAIDAVDEAFVLYDPDDRLVMCNQRYRDAYPGIAHLMVPGIAFEELVRAGVARGDYKDAVGREEEWIAERLRTHREGGYLLVQPQADGRVLRVIENRLPDGHIVGFRIDITDLVRATEAAEAASRAKGEFLANMSHEIRTPLHALIGLSHLLADTPLSARQRQLLGKSQMASQSLLGIVNDVLDMAKIEAGALVLEDEPFSPAALLAELDAVFHQQAESKGLTLSVQAAPDLPTQVRGDALRLRQIITNLLGNALKFTSEGGVSLALRPVDGVPGLVRLRGEVRDTGDGISPEVQARLFQPFSQADASTSRRHGGSGLGLSIVRRLVELMDGTIGVHSAVGQGSLFWFEVALKPVDATLGAVHAGSSALEVLVVDDVADERQALVDMARAFGWRTESCDSGEAMIAWMEQRLSSGQALPDAMLVDWQMQGDDGSGMDGLQALAALAERHGLSRLPAALMVSASERERVAREDRLRLADDILTKPVNASVLFNAVNQGVVTRHGHSGRVLGAQRAQPGSPGQRLNGARVLVVDDSEINQEIAQHMLQREGARVFLAGNGREALAVLRDDPAGFDLVLMDVQMPEMDGLQATRALRQDQVLQKLPVVALTAGALAEERRRALDAGMDHFLTKPLDPDQLVDTVAGVLGRQGVLPAMDAADETTQPAPRGGLPSDWPHIDGIDAAQAARRLGGDTGLLRRSLQRLFDEFGEFTDLPAPSNLQTEDARRLAGRMHKLRGAAGLIDALELHRLAGELENGLRDGAAEADLSARWASMQAAIRRLHLAAAPWLDQAVPVAEPSPDQPPASDEELRRLLDLLSRHDLDALPLFESRRAALHKRLGSTRLNDLAARVDALDFSSAVALLQGELTDGTPS